MADLKGTEDDSRQWCRFLSSRPRHLRGAPPHVTPQSAQSTANAVAFAVRAAKQRKRTSLRNLRMMSLPLSLLLPLPPKVANPLSAFISAAAASGGPTGPPRRATRRAFISAASEAHGERLHIRPRFFRAELGPQHHVIDQPRRPHERGESEDGWRGDAVD